MLAQTLLRSVVVMRCLLLAVLVASLLAACGDAGSGNEADGEDTLTTESRPIPSDTADIRGEMLTPATLKDPRIETLSGAERRLLQDYVNRGIRRDSLEAPGSRNSLGDWLDSNLTVGEVIALYRGTQKIEPLPPGRATP
jgi:hypothetical protein